MEYYKKSGKIAGEALEYAKSLVKEDAKILEVTEKVEEFIKKKKAEPAFPVQFSINEIAAHYTAFPDDELTFKESDLVKIDIGISANGFIGDTAATVEIKTNNHQEIIESSRKALNEAIKICAIGIEINKIGKTIAETIESFNLKPIKNLSGHSLDQYEVHSGITIPNYDNNDTTKLKENQVIAIEPFATEGIGYVKEGKPSSIFRIISLKNTRDITARKLLEFVTKNYKTLPFAKRNLLKHFQPFQLNRALKDLEHNKILHQYPQLIERSNGLVSQAEHSILIKEKPIILTKI